MDPDPDFHGAVPQNVQVPAAHRMTNCRVVKPTGGPHRIQGPPDLVRAKLLRRDRERGLIRPLKRPAPPVCTRGVPRGFPSAGVERCLIGQRQRPRHVAAYCHDVWEETISNTSLTQSTGVMFPGQPDLEGGHNLFLDRESRSFGRTKQVQPVELKFRTITV